MSEPYIDVSGAPVIYSNKKSKPKNPLNRPKINYKKFVFSLVGFVSTITLSLILGKYFVWELVMPYTDLKQWAFLILFTMTIGLVYIICIQKRALIWLIHFYQHYAPDRIRLKCVFEPSCSEYMILSIRKYGSIIGVLKGALRLLRCHPPNGGKDYP